MTREKEKVFWSCPNPICSIETTVGKGTKVHCVCGLISSAEGEPVPPSILKRGTNFIQSWLIWSAAGKPRRSDEQVEALRQVCASCELFDGQVCTHGACGCPVDRPGAFGDKLSWATEKCPIGQWGGEEPP